MPDIFSEQFNTAADSLIAAHDGDVALLWLYICRNGSFDAESAARQLMRTTDEIRKAEEKLRLLGLTEPAKDAEQAAPRKQILPPPDELPEYRTEDIMNRLREDTVYKAIQDEAGKVLGHRLSGEENKKLFGIYDYLRLPPEVIMLLLNHCVSTSRTWSGEMRRPSMRYIEKEAYVWVNREIMTLEQAEEYIAAQRARRESLSAVCHALGISGRALTQKEKSYIGAWLDMGFPAESITEAYERTVLNIGSLKWPYMNRILENWHKNGIHSIPEINEKDPPRKQRRDEADGKGGRSVSTKDLDWLLNSLGDK